MKLATALSMLAITSLLLGVSYYGSVSYAIGAPVATSTTACVPAADPFLVTGATWGTPTSPVSAGPGDQNDPLTVTLLYTGGCALIAAGFELTLTQPFTALDGSNESTTYEVNVATEATLTETYHVNIGTNASLQTYTLPLSIGYNTSDFAGIFSQSTNVTISLKGSAKIDFAASAATFSPGAINNFTLSISNGGTGVATSVSTSVTGPSQVSILNQPSVVMTLEPGGTISQQIRVYVPSSMSGSALSLTVTSSYLDPYSAEGSATRVFGFVVSLTQSLPPLSVGLTQVNASTVVGTESKIAFILENVGEGTIYSPTLSLTAPSPMVVTNSSGVGFVPQLQPGQNIAYAVVVGSSPSATPGIYQGTVTVTYADANGGQHTQTFPAGFVLLGRVQFVIQDATVSQTTTSVTVSGSLLNEGATNAYYAEVSGHVGRERVQNSSYVGEVDPNTPTPFTLTLSYPAPSSPQTGVQIILTVTYRDSFGNVANYTSPVNANLQSATQLLIGSVSTTSGSASSGGDLLTLVSYSVIVVVIVTIVGAVLYIRRTRASTRPAKEDKVI